MDNRARRKGRELLFASTDSVLEAGSRLPGSDHGIRTAAHVDLERFMGDWYVIACIPTPLERGVRDAMESYRLEGDGSIATRFRYRRDVDGRPRTLKARGFVREQGSNAVWGMQFVWPVKADYRIMQVNREYTQAVIGRNKRDYAWIMARTPTMPHRDFFSHVRLLRDEGYDTDRLRIVPQREARRAAPPAEGARA